jgi:hypothetical protein
MRTPRLLSLVLPGLLATAAAMADPARLPAPVDRPVDFIHDIHPILAEHCFTCHGGSVSKGDFQLDTRRRLMQGAAGEPMVIEGDSAGSRLIHLVAALDPDDVMPPKGRRLNPTEVGLLRAWIDQGAPWADVAAAFESKVPLALQPVMVPETAGAEHPIDRFVHRYTAEKGLDIPAPVDDARFLRRVHLDVTGLLPAPQVLEAFLADTAPDKRTRAIDALLADRQAYAEHWMTFWNDLLRNDYQGTGYIDGGRKQISDWLYDALHENLPYDAFVRELVSPRPDSEGFIKGIVWRGDNAIVQTPPLQAARNIGQVFLGLNLKCASCHDSFTDHWQLRSVYNLANVFSETPLELTRCDVPLGQPAGYDFLWPELGTVDGSLSRRDRMAQVAQLITTPANGMFPRTVVNRIWDRFMGRGLVEPLDMIEVGAWHPELLDWLAADFVEHGYDLQHLMRRIATSAVYQWPTVDPAPADGDYVFRGPVVRRMTAEQFYDALGSVTGIWQARPKFLLPAEREDAAEAERQARLAREAAGGKVEQAAPEDNTVEARRKPVRAWRVPADPLSTALGRTNREQVTTRRESLCTTLQALELSNGDTLDTHLRLGAENLLQQDWSAPAALVDTLYLRALQRPPTTAERDVALALLGTGESPVAGAQDLLWGLAMLPEFQIIR